MRESKGSAVPRLCGPSATAPTSAGLGVRNGPKDDTSVMFQMSGKQTLLDRAVDDQVKAHLSIGILPCGGLLSPLSRYRHSRSCRISN